MRLRVGSFVLAASGLLAGCTTYLQDLSPADPLVKVPPTKYESTIATYQSEPEVERPSSWVELNDRQLRLGGHQGHLEGTPRATDADVPDTPPMEHGAPVDRAVERDDLPAKKTQ